MKKTKFNIGDKVKAADGFGTALLVPGEVYEVIDIDDHGNAVVNTCADPAGLFYPDHWLQKVEIQ